MTAPAPAPMPYPVDDWTRRDRERLLAELRCWRLHLQLELATVDEIGLMLRDNMLSPSAARAWWADLYAPAEEAAPDD